MSNYFNIKIKISRPKGSDGSISSGTLCAVIYILALLMAFLTFSKNPVRF